MECGGNAAALQCVAESQHMNLREEIAAIDAHAEELNREAEEVLEYQEGWTDAEGDEVQPERP